jgi:hypothetical protein
MRCGAPLASWWGAASRKSQGQTGHFSPQGDDNMKKLLIVAAVLALSVAPALANPIDAGNNGLGVFFDTGATINCATPTPYTTLTGYLIAYNLTAPSGGLSAFEATLCINPTTFAAGLTLDGGAGFINALTPPVFFCGISPARSGQTIILVTISTFYLGGPIQFGVGPSVPSSFNGMAAGYADAIDPGILVPFVPSCATPWTLPIWKGSNTDERLPANGPANSFLVASVPCPGPVATENSTWGGVKDLYK